MGSETSSLKLWLWKAVLDVGSGCVCDGAALICLFKVLGMCIKFIRAPVLLCQVKHILS